MLMLAVPEILSSPVWWDADHQLEPFAVYRLLLVCLYSSVETENPALDSK